MSSTNKQKSSESKLPTRRGFLSVEVVKPRPLPDGIYVGLYDGDNDDFHLDTQELRERLEFEITNARRELYLNIDNQRINLDNIIENTGRHERQINIIINRGSPEQRTVKLRLILEYVNSGGETYFASTE